MRRLLTLGLLWTAVSGAVDVTGEWRRHDGDDLRWAAPDFDDRDWTRVSLTDLPKIRGTYWLRRTVILPEAIDDPAIALGTFAWSYEIYLDGTKVAAVEPSVTSAYFSPHWFALPVGSLRAGRTVTLAIRVPDSRVQFDFLAGLPDRGPYLIGSRQEVRAATEFTLLRHQHTNSLTLVAASLQLVLALLLTFFWVSGSRRPELVWFVGCLLCFGIRNVWLVASAYQELDRRWPLLLMLAGLACLGSSLAALSRLSVWAPWLVAVTAMVPVATGWPEASIPVLFWIAGAPLLPIMVSAWSLWRQKGPPRQFAWPVLLYLAAVANTLAQGIPGWPIPASFFIGPFQVYISLWMSTVFGFTVGLLMIQIASGERREKARLARELEAARTVQRLLLTPMTALSAYAIEVAYEPASEVGGDFSIMLPVGRENEFLLVAGDVSGKGLKAAMVVTLLAGALRNRHSSEPAEILAELNAVAAASLDTGFVTAIVARFHASGTVRLANAGHPAPYLAGQELALEPGLPLGIDLTAQYRESQFTMVAGEQISFVSDGVVEAENTRRELFGFDRAREISKRSAQQIADAAQAWGQNDDITAVTVRRSVA